MSIPTDGRSRHIAMVVFDGVRTLDLTGPLEVFDVAQALGCRYSIGLYSSSGATSVRCSSGLSIDAAPASVAASEVDTLLVPGGECLVAGGVPAHLRRAIRALAPGARRIASICAGSFALAAAGVLDGRRATTHWRHLDTFARRYPSTRVERESVYTRDGETWTSSGGTAGIDLALALVGDDFGAAVAQEISKEMVVLGRRMEGHPQISAAARTPRPKHPELERLMATVVVNPAGHYELETVAAQLGLSPRHLARLFKAQVGVTLREYVNEVRLENAVALVLAGESFHAAAQRSGLRSGARVRDHLIARRTPA
ncbi:MULTISPECIES: GlxA family transcriptional regulator [Mycolicibacterium]|jgi:transcriptional regulator GlxA family with amidase domain|uniref:Transcriptional regulator, AraC family with amidase-like domain n=2 Tax=Mycolicibacterium TaxID=1866885 RepID=A1THE3_MYCVP|nr:MULTISPECIES: DJ-1/PfpI family protein [Mycolicibacterium]ABM16593.1 transcriptional regulator, AraC family with amidase-like domain [Mycolicibacterium vanbaalenii PYR-1]MCV7131118.1 DJ-1/PfpI family protein [Mycolicibacterium vanbaalenii PYR-1]MDN4522775.1 DJ-1/PfpI family protein [Mycolicibacterium austroafricanum]PQP40274.1 AraC family transcriptional regulator [Mycolicibacterium austroafricanum]QRZ06878.1 DJ-1/PfpI family protein [Mycolicibacterium austroafricanum]